MSAAFNSPLPAPHSCRILVVGDLILDEYWRGGVRRLSPEAPVPVLDPVQRSEAGGGAANVAVNLHALGCDVALCGVVGNDAPGDALLALLAPSLDTSGVLRDAARPTTHKLRLVSEAQHLLRIDRETDAVLGADMQAALTAKVHQLLPGVQGVICSDYGKGLLQPAFLRTLIQACRAAAVPIFVDPKGLDLSRYSGATVLTPNAAELGLATRTTLRGPQDMATAAQRAFEQTEAAAILVTCGKDGMRLFERRPPATVQQTHIAAQAREVFDVTGAGDTVVATLALAHLGGLQLGDAAELANVAAGLAVGKQGTASVSRDELLAACDTLQGSGSHKILDLAQATVLVRRRQHAGCRVVFTNGCFDLLHAGHVHYLQAARALGGYLVVGLNGDAGVRALKGSGRPLVPQAERAFLLTALQCVDAVVIFAEATPAAIIAALQPDVLVKGTDYAEKEVVGREVVERRGGHVALMPLAFGRSTSGLVQTIVQRYGGPAEPASSPLT